MYHTFLDFLEGATGCRIFEGEEDDPLEMSYICEHGWMFERMEVMRNTNTVAKQHREFVENVEQ
jgi:hypothetical protein